MFIQFFIWGATGPVLSLYLKDCLGFSGAQVGLVLGLSGIGSIVSPTLMTFIADRIISSERLLCLLNALGGVFMLFFARQTEFYPTLLVYFIYCMVMHPAVPLINAITFHHAPTDRRKFGNIRVWGTLGWIAVAWVFSFLVMGDRSLSDNGASPLPLVLKISAVTSFIMAAYSLTIPVKKITSDGDYGKKRAFFPMEAFRVVFKPQVLAISLIAAALTIADKFYSLGTAPFLKQSGFAEKDIMPAMTLGQVPEIAAMGILGFLLKRWGPKAVLAIGVGIGIFRFAACAVGSSRALIYAGLSVHGLVYTFTMITAVICLDSFCGDRDRSGVHQLFAVLTGGIGGFLGNYAAGLTADRFTDSSGFVNYGAYWSVPLALSVIILGSVFMLRNPEQNAL
jgi:MFS family permease